MKLKTLLNIPYEFQIDSFCENVKKLSTLANKEGIYFHDNKKFQLSVANPIPHFLKCDGIYLDNELCELEGSSYNLESKKIKFKGISLKDHFFIENNLKSEALDNLKTILNFIRQDKKNHRFVLESEINEAFYGCLDENPNLYIEKIFLMIEKNVENNVYDTNYLNPIISPILKEYIQKARETKDLSYILIIYYYFKNLASTSGTGFWEFKL